MKYLIALLASFTFPNLIKSQDYDLLTIELSKTFEKSSLKGLGIAIVNENGIAYQRGFGYADMESNRAYNSFTVQPIGSISKTFIGVSIMKAQELGMLSLDDDINKYLPFKLINPHYPAKKITIRHLATHTSSIQDTKHYEKAYLFEEALPVNDMKGFKKEAKIYNSNIQLSQSDFIQNIYASEGKWYSSSNFLKNPPGEKYEYSNNGAAIASMVVANASGMDYKNFVEKYILEPLEMKHSGWRMGEQPDDTRTTLYLENIPLPNYNLITYADGGFVTSIDEFAKYFTAIMRGYFKMEQPLLDHVSFQELLTPQHDSEERPGIFWVAGDKRIGHTGGDPGLITVAYFNRSNPIGIIIFTNTNHTKLEGEDVAKIFRIASKFITENN